jgi:hypothetical protein
MLPPVRRSVRRLMPRCRFLAVFAVAFALAACNQERSRECHLFLSAMRTLDETKPSADVVDHVRDEVEAIRFQDQPLSVYAKNYASTLTVLASTLKLQAATPEPPDGTEDVIKRNLNEARVDRADTVRYCSR